jgi:sulfopyruvate decarboxylase subunit beta
MNPLDAVVSAVKSAEVDIVLHLPGGKIASLLDVLTEKAKDIQLTREEEGVGMAAGISLAGSKPMMVIQGSGLGNMVNAIMSLSRFYELPLPIFISHRGIYREDIPAQIPMGEHLEDILDAMGIEHFSFHDSAHLKGISRLVSETFDRNIVRCFLFSPKVWEGQPRKPHAPIKRIQCKISESHESIQKPKERYEVIKELSWFLKDKAVICNMGYPSRELYSAFDQDSNFYMLGSLGMASSIGLGVSLFSDKEVVVIDGDGSLLMNPNTLISIGALQPENLTVLCLDNGTYSSTGQQPTLSGCGLQLEGLARAAGIGKILITDSPDSVETLKGPGPKFVRLVVKSGNANVGCVTLNPLEIKERFQSWLRV